MTGASRKKILVIKLGALGDFIQATGPMAAIRKHHVGDHITLLTTKPFENFASACGYFNEIWIDQKPGMLDISGWIALKKQLKAGDFSRVYDLQNNDRTAFYFSLFGLKKPEWVGAARGASHRNASHERTAGHALDGHAQTLALAGIKNVEVDPLLWLDENISVFPLKKPYILLVPGSAPEHLQKRWPAAHYARLAVMLAKLGFQPVILGAKAEEKEASEITSACPEAINLTGRTTLAHIATLARSAAAAIGNDTGPMHMIAATGCPVVTLFSSSSNPVRHAPKGADVQILRQDNLADLKPEDVLKSVRPRGAPAMQASTTH